MNVPTILTQAISNQLTLPLFSGESRAEDPILFFGYQKDRFGNIVNPQLVYLDEDKLQWVITEQDLDTKISVQLPKEAPKVAEPLLKKGKGSDRKAN